jgi:hypothetical protein
MFCFLSTPPRTARSDLLWVTTAGLQLLVLIAVFYGPQLKMHIEFIENELAKSTWFGRIDWCRYLGSDV